MKAMAYLELAASDSRIITPAFAQVAVFCTFSTLAVIEPLPLRLLYTKRKPSDVYQISEPVDWTTKTPSDWMREPASPTVVRSRESHVGDWAKTPRGTTESAEVVVPAVADMV